MAGIALGETSSSTNPCLTFMYQSGGLLTDVYDLYLEIVETLTGTVRRANAVVDITDAPTGNRLSIGRYSAPFAAVSTPIGSAWNLGTHTAIWRYRLVNGGTQYTVKQNFEVLDASEFASGAAYVGYVSTKDLKTSTPFTTMPLGAVQRAIDEASRRVELWTGRFFEPRYLSLEIDGPGTGALLFGPPVIAVGAVYELGTGPADQLFEIDRTALRVYNRHLTGLTDPDDRDNPKIEFVTDVLPGAVVDQGTFSPGAKNLQVLGVFGYTDADGTPLGCTPRILTRVIGLVAGRQQLDPLGLDASVSAPGRIKSARTRDQAVTFETGSGGSSWAYTGAVTGDRTLDDYLLLLLRPPHVGAV